MEEIVFENDEIIVINKPQGIASTPGRIEDMCTRLFTNRPELLSVKGYRDGEGGLLNRLDNETGGLLLFAVTNEAFEKYKELMWLKQIVKEYHAVVDAVSDQKEGKISTPIAHHFKKASHMCLVTQKVRYRGEPQISNTQWELIKSANEKLLLRVHITKGVRHQIRIHLASVDMPIVGDKLYNPLPSPVPNHLLYATGLTITDNDGEVKKISIPIPESFLQAF